MAPFSLPLPYSILYTQWLHFDCSFMPLSLSGILNHLVIIEHAIFLFCRAPQVHHTHIHTLTLMYVHVCTQ